MNPLQAMRRSKTTLLISKYLSPLFIVTILAGLSSVGMFALIFYPAQDRFQHITALYQASLHTQTTMQTAKQTQTILSTTWKALPDSGEFTDLSFDIAHLAKQNHVHIPGMGYDFKPLPINWRRKARLRLKPQDPTRLFENLFSNWNNAGPISLSKNSPLKHLKNSKGSSLS